MVISTEAVSDAPAEQSEQGALEELLLAISAELANASLEGIDAAVRRSLQRLCAHVDADRAYIFQFSSDGTTMTATHDACRNGVVSALGSFKNVPVSVVPWGMGRVKGGLPVVIAEPSAFPEEAVGERAAMVAQGICSLVTLPLRANGKVLGGIGLDWLRRPGRWTPRTLTLLHLVGEIIAGTLGRGRVEDELRATERRLRSFILHTEDAVFCYEPLGGISLSLPADAQFEALLDAPLVECNAAYARARGMGDPEALRGHSLRELSFEPRDVLRARYTYMLEAGFHLDSVPDQQTLTDGSVRTVVAFIRGVVEDRKLVRLWGILRDVSEQRRAEAERAAIEAQLRTVQKLESIGLLAGGVAHDFNNLLMAMMGFARLAELDLTRRPSSVPSHLAQIEAAGERAASLTRQLLALSRQQPLERRPVDVNELVEGILLLLRRVIRESIAVSFTPANPIGLVHADPGQLEQVLVNLCVNARDAISDVGEIHIATREVTLDEEGVRAYPWATPGFYLAMDVRDTGAGMPCAVRERIFEPFFSTKESNKGTGLGLAVVYGIVRQHGGIVRVETHEGQGTVFSVYLPVVDALTAKYTSSPPPRSSGGGETILVAEDDDGVRRIVTTILGDAGYTVHQARDGAEATRIFDEQGDAIDLVLLDVVMPVLSGKGVYEHILASRANRANRQSVKVLFTSGHASGVFPEGFEGMATRLLPKPYSSETLLLRVRSLLDTTADAIEGETLTPRRS